MSVIFSTFFYKLKIFHSYKLFKKEVSKPDIWRIILFVGGGFRKFKVQNIYDDHKINIFQLLLI